MSSEPPIASKPGMYYEGSEAHAALERFRAQEASVVDLLFLASLELVGAMDVLPPIAVAPLANNIGDVVQADPMHASACAMRARSFVNLARRRLVGGP